MYLGVVGRKCGMTCLFSDNGSALPVTVVHVGLNKITQIKNIDTDGYCAVQVTTGLKKRSHINKAESGHFLKSMIEPGRNLWEFRLLALSSKYYLGQCIDLSLFKIGQKVDVTGISKGKGFQGVVKRYNFKTQDATHGNSLSHRAHGSTGQNQTPGRVFKNKKMAGHMGNVRITMQSLKIIDIDHDNGLLLIKGSIPGPTGSDIVVKSSIKSRISINMDIKK